MAFALLGILLALTTVSLRSSITKEGSRGLAYALASELRSARSEAQRSGKYVAVAFPSEGKTVPYSRSALLRRGDQRGDIWRSLNFEEEFEATIFLGKWSDEPVVTDNALPPSWLTSTRDEIAIFFRPDGTAFSNDLHPLHSDFPIVVGSGFVGGSGSGPESTLTGVSNPQTVWVSSSGTVRVESNKVPQGVLPVGEANVRIAKFDTRSGSTSVPEIRSAVLHPKPIDTDEGAGVAQSFVQIHPFQKDGDQLEYGLVTLEVEAIDSDGGPLSYVLSADLVRGSGDTGAFSVPDLHGKMRFVQDPRTRQHVWKATVSWRPPPGAPAKSLYNLTLKVVDPEGNEAVVSSETELLPRIVSLPPARIVMATGEGRLYLTNLDGGGHTLITRDGAEYLPFFSRDGSRIFSFHPLDTGEYELRSRAANGTTSFDPLANFTGNPRDVWIDPTACYAVLLGGSRRVGFPWGIAVQTSSGGDDSEPSYELQRGAEVADLHSLFIVNLMTGRQIQAADNAKANTFHWASNRNGFFSYEEIVAKAPVPLPGGLGSHPPPPGFEDRPVNKFLAWDPFTSVRTTLPVESARDRRYNPANSGWYAQVHGSELRVHHHASGQTLNVTSGAFEVSSFGQKNPTWSANGQCLTFIQSPGSGAVIKAFRVFDNAGAPLARPEEIFSLARPNATLAQLDPEGEWVYFLDEAKIYRCSIAHPARSPVEVSAEIKSAGATASMQSYVISP